MQKKKEEFNESYEKSKILLYEFINYKKNEIYIYNRCMGIKAKTELKKCNYKYLPKELTFNFFKFPLNCSCNKVKMNFIKSIAIYQLFILQFAVTIAEANQNQESQEDTLSIIKKQVTEKAELFWNIFTAYLCIICKYFGDDKETCKKKIIAIPVIVVLFVLVFSIICLICCKCCCKKSRKKKASEDSNVNHDQFIMGPDGQMYSQMYQGQMVQPQMIPAEMMYPQVVQGQMFYPQMLQQGMQQPEMQYMEMQQPEMQEPRNKRKKKKRSPEHINSNDDLFNVAYSSM